MFSQTIEQVSHNVDSEYQGSDVSTTLRRNASRRECGEDVIRRSLREERQLDYLKDYEVQLNHCSITSCFFIGASNEEEWGCYEEAKGCLEWEATMQDEIELLRKNDTWKLCTKTKKLGTNHLQMDLSFGKEIRWYNWQV